MCKDTNLVDTVAGYAADPSADKSRYERADRILPPGVPASGGTGQFPNQQTNNARQLIWKQIYELEEKARALRNLSAMLPAELTVTQDYDLALLLRK